MVTAIPFILDEIQVMLRFTGKGNLPEVQTAVRAARRIIESRNIITEVAGKEEAVLSAVEKIIFLKGVPFFEDMTVNQLKALATVTEEQFFPTDKTIFDEGDAGGILYVVVSGRVGIERKNRATGTSARLSTIEARGYFGEATLFDASPNFTTAIALQDTLTLRLRHEPLVALMQEYPDLSLQLIKVLSKRIQETDVQVADLSRRRSRTMHKLYDKLG
jgi:CRP-like cAMP-binding protein